MNWIAKRQYSQQERADLQAQLNIHPLFIQLLLQRGITTFDQARDFFRPALTNLYNPYRMKDMDKAVQRIQKALQKRENILIYGDYDVDGTTAVSMVYSFFKKELGHSNLAYYIPDRYTEGYGVSDKGISFAADNDFSLIITLDCGIKSFDKILIAQTHNIDVIICDHHIPGEILPPAIAILNPKQNDCPYPFKELSGCGVGFKLLQALADTNGINEEAVFDYIDFAAISTCADIVPIVDENRILVYHGIKKFNENPRDGFLHLLRRAGADNRELNVEDAVFILGPRINAAGRIAHASRVVELLSGENEELLDELSKNINTNNQERQELDRNMTQEALQQIAEDPSWASRKSTVLYNPDWHKGVVGIVASRVIETHYRPTIILTHSQDKITGSARSVAGFDLYDALSDCDDLLTNWGGHAFAAGLSMEPDMLDAFKEAFDKAVSKRITEDQLIPKLDYDAEVPLGLLTPSFYRILKQFAPFGPGNPTPQFCVKNLKIYNQNLRLLKDQHLQMQIYAEGDIHNVFNAIGFKLGKYYDQLWNKEKFHIICSLRENHFNGNTTLQIEVKDIKF